MSARAASSTRGASSGHAIDTAHPHGDERGEGASPDGPAASGRPFAVWISTVFGVGYAPLYDPENLKPRS